MLKQITTFTQKIMVHREKITRVRTVHFLKRRDKNVPINLFLTRHDKRSGYKGAAVNNNSKSIQNHKNSHLTHTKKRQGKKR